MGGQCMYVAKAATSYHTILRDLDCTDARNFFACDAPVFVTTRVETLEQELATLDGEVETGLTSVNTKVSAVEQDLATMQTRLNSLERIMMGINNAIDAEQSVSAPVGFGVYADYALYALALSNLVVLLCLFAFCMVRRVPTKVQYGRVYDSETETDKL